MKNNKTAIRLKQFARLASDFFFPPICIACDEVLEPGTNEKLCPICKKKWSTAKLSLRAKFNGAPVVPLSLDGISDERGSAIASLCDYHSNALDSDYEIQKIIVIELKRHEYSRLTDFAAEELYRLVYEVMNARFYKSDVVVRIPRNRKNIVRDGADNMKVVAKTLTQKLGVTFVDGFRQRYGVKEQKRLSAKERATNIEKGIYLTPKAKKMIKNRRVILLDDVITTGSSVTTAAKLLYAAGAKQVFIFSLTMNSEHLLRLYDFN